MSRRPTQASTGAVGAVLLAAVLLSSCGSPGPSSTSAPSLTTTSHHQIDGTPTATGTATGTTSRSAVRPSAGGATPGGPPRLANGLPVLVPTGYAVQSAGGNGPVQLSWEASVISVAVSTRTDADDIAADVLAGAQNEGLLTDVQEVGTVRYAPTGHATGETMIGYTATLHVGRTKVSVEGAAVGIVRDDGRATRVLWLEPPGSRNRYSGAYRDVLVSLTE